MEHFRVQQARLKKETGEVPENLPHKEIRLEN